MNDSKQLVDYIIAELKKKLFYLQHHRHANTEVTFYVNKHSVNYSLCAVQLYDAYFTWTKFDGSTIKYDYFFLDVDKVINEIYQYIITDTEYKPIFDLKV